MKRLFCFLILIMICVGCAPKEFKPFEPPPINFEKTQEYKLDLSTIKKPEKLNPVFLNDVFQEVPVEQATNVLFSQAEYTKIGALVELAVTYKKIAIEEEALINLHINTINSLKEFLELERAKSLQYRSLWVDAENKYRYEAWEHKKDNFWYKTEILGISVGAITGLVFLGI